MALWRITTYHGDDPLFLGGIQYFDRTRSRFFIESTGETRLLIAMAKAPNGLRGQRDHLGNLRGTGMVR